MSDFSELVAVITGGASGIGAATADLISSRGGQVVVLDRDLNPAHQSITCDITEDDQLGAAVAQVAARYGRADVLVNNAGIGAAGDVSANDRGEWLDVLNVNVVSMARVAASFLPLLRRSPHAAIVNVSSVLAVIGVRNRALYAASKGAVASLTLAMAADHLADRIRVNAVTPGTTETPWVQRLVDAAPDREELARALAARQPIGRLVSADEVAQAIAYLASPLAGSTTGTLLGVDGGMGSLRV